MKNNTTSVALFAFFASASTFAAATAQRGSLLLLPQTDSTTLQAPASSSVEPVTGGNIFIGDDLHYQNIEHDAIQLIPVFETEITDPEPAPPLPGNSSSTSSRSSASSSSVTRQASSVGASVQSSAPTISRRNRGGSAYAVRTSSKHIFATQKNETQKISNGTDRSDFFLEDHFAADCKIGFGVGATEKDCEPHYDGTGGKKIIVKPDGNKKQYLIDGNIWLNSPEPFNFIVPSGAQERRQERLQKRSEAENSERSGNIHFGDPSASTTMRTSGSDDAVRRKAERCMKSEELVVSTACAAIIAGVQAASEPASPPPPLDSKIGSNTGRGYRTIDGAVRSKILNPTPAKNVEESAE